MIDAKLVEHNGQYYTRINGIWFILSMISVDEVNYPDHVQLHEALHEKFHDEIMKRTPAPGVFISETGFNIEQAAKIYTAGFKAGLSNGKR